MHTEQERKPIVLNRIGELAKSKQPMTLEDLNKLLAPMYKRAAEAKAEQILRAHEDMIAMGWKPPGPWKRRWLKFHSLLARVHLAWRVLRGDNIGW